MTASGACVDRAGARRDEIIPVLAETYGRAEAEIWLQRWRMFFMACSELFRYRNGEEWFVGHYLFKAE